MRLCSDQNEVMSVLREEGRTEQPEMEAKGRWMGDSGTADKVSVCVGRLFAYGSLFGMLTEVSRRHFSQICN